MTRELWTRAVVKHQLSHLRPSNYLPKAPDWLDEGLACAVETARYDPSSETITLGRSTPGGSTSLPPSERLS